MYKKWFTPVLAEMVFLLYSSTRYTDYELQRLDNVRRCAHMHPRSLLSKQDA